MATPTGQPAPTGTSESDQTAILLAFSALADDPRVRRMGDALHARGWRVIGIGLSGASSPPPAWEIHEARTPPAGVARAVSEPAPAENEPRLRFVIQKFLLRPSELTATDRSRLASLVLAPIRQIVRKAARLALWAIALALAGLVALVALGATLARRPLSGRVWGLAAKMASFTHGPARLMEYLTLWRRARSKGEAADRAFWEEPSSVLLPMREAALAHGAHGLWIANDWNTLALASEGVGKYGGAYVYDSHEFAVEEFAQDIYWRLFKRPLVATLERRHIEGAKVVTTVSPGITAALRRRYHLTQPCRTLRNVPRYRETPFRAASPPFRALYQGIVLEARGLEAVIESVAQWRPEFQLAIRGPGPESYLRTLRALAERHGVAERVAFLPPVPASELVQAASSFDIGLMALPGHSAHNAHALPNKVFEYLMAGLVLCVSDLPAMRQVVDETGAGVLISSMKPQSIARAINALSDARINLMKHAALAAAKRLHFDAEVEPVLQLYEAAIAEPPV